MKKLILLRHAKSSWEDPALPDHDRPLNPRGRRAAPLIGEWLAARGHVPDRILCSPARRTQETLALMTRAVPSLPEAEIEPGLYHASPAQMLARLRRLPADCAGVMLIGHQPGLGGFARKLSGGAVRAGCARAFAHFPTAAAAVLLLPIDDWGEIAHGTADFVDFAMPREIEHDRGKAAGSA